jgi:hypothetical protein
MLLGDLLVGFVLGDLLVGSVSLIVVSRVVCCVLNSGSILIRNMQCTLLKKVEKIMLQIHSNTSSNYMLWPVDKSNKDQTQAPTTLGTDYDEVTKHMGKTEVIKHMSVLPKNRVDPALPPPPLFV